MTRTLNHLKENVLPAVADYESAEEELSIAFNRDHAPDHWIDEARNAKRRAAEMAIAIDGLTDRASHDLALNKRTIRQLVGPLCVWPGPNSVGRVDAHDRIRGVANAYKHSNLSDPDLPIESEDDVLVVGLGFGKDAWGAGKWSGVEVIVKDKKGVEWKFLADVPCVIHGWLKFLKDQGASIPAGPYEVCGRRIEI
ncbi:MAG: hypothetical protein FJW32_06395 [Acidobacteria bacterium]|nr:hypothetical protein [Acidobacteriota bacterium]